MIGNIIAHPIRSTLIVLALMIAFGAAPSTVGYVGHAIVITASRTAGVAVSLLPDAPKGFKQGMDAGKKVSGRDQTQFSGTSWAGGTGDIWNGGGQAAPAQPNVTPAAQRRADAKAAERRAERKIQAKADRKAAAKKRAAEKRAAERREARKNSAPA